MPVVLLAVAAVILIGVIAVAVGRGGELDPAEADYRPVDLDEVTSTDVALMRPPTALFGYHREATDAAFGQIARAISEREVEIATLRRQLAEQLPVRTSPALRADPPLPPGSAFGAGPRPDPTGPDTGPVTRAGLPTRPPTRPPARLPAEPPARLPAAPPARLPAEPPADGQWQAPQPQAPLPSRPVSPWPPPATTKAGSLRPEPMPNSSMPYIPSSAAPGAQDPSGTAAGTHGPDQGSPPSRPSVLHRELADPPAGHEPGAEADPWLVWQRRTEYPAGQDAPPPTAGPHFAGSGEDDDTDPGEQR